MHLGRPLCAQALHSPPEVKHELRVERQLCAQVEAHGVLRTVVTKALHRKGQVQLKLAQKMQDTVALKGQVQLKLAQKMQDTAALKGQVQLKSAQKMQDTAALASFIHTWMEPQGTARESRSN